MTHNTNITESEALYAYLRGQSPERNAELPIQEANLGDALKAAANKIQPDPTFQAELECQLYKAFQVRQPRSSGRLTRFAWAFIWIVLGIVFLFGMSWAIQNLIPRFIPLAVESDIQVSRTIVPPTVRPGLATENTLEKVTPTTSSTLKQEGTPVTYTSPMFPGVEISMQVDFPEAPPTTTVYLQVSKEAISIENAREVAAKLGVIGSVYRMPGENPATPNYTVTDGLSRVVFLNSTDQFYFVADYVASLLMINNRSTSPEEVTKAEAFLKEHGLLDYPYQVETSHINPGRIIFTQLLEGHPVRYSIFDAPQIGVHLDGQGRVASIDSNLLSFQVVGKYDIRSAREAWEKVLSSETPLGVEFTTVNIEPANLQSWQREYPTGKRVEMFGFFEVLQPAKPGESPFIAFNNYPVSGDMNKLLQTVNPGNFMQVWGQFQADEKGRRNLHIEGWQISNFPDQTLEGIIQRREDQDLLLTPDQELLLPELPENIPDATQVTVRGVILELAQPTLEWLWITTGSAGGGGGGGGPSFTELNLDGTPGSSLTSTVPLLPPIQTGEPVDGVQGTPYIIQHQYKDGSSHYEVNLQLEPQETWPDGLAVRLEGTGLQGIESYHMLPIRVWGAFTDTSSLVPTISIQRFEPVYPGLSIQAWLGIVETIHLEDQEVLRFTTQDGAQFILGYSINQEPDSLIGNPGDRIILEGIVFPDESFHGYPIINILDVSLAQGKSDLSDYQIRTASPQIIQESGSATILGKATIEKIELVYHTTDMRFAIVALGDPPPYVQPVWRFTGYYEDGTPFEILVQALIDRYLK